MKRFIGLRPFDAALSHLFFGREQDITQLTKLIFRERLVLLHSAPNLGKTSLIKAGLIPSLKRDLDFFPIYITIKPYEQYIDNNLINTIRTELKHWIKEISYLDKLADDDNSLWYAFKKLQAAKEEKTFVLILDQFENFFTYPPKQRQDFREQLAQVLFEQIPINLKPIIDDKIKEHADLLTAHGYKMLYSDIKLKILFSLDSNKLSDFEFITKRFSTLKDNIYQLTAFSEQTAQMIISKTAEYEDNYIESQRFEISEEVLTQITKFLASRNNGQITGAQIQLIGQELEKIVIDNEINKILPEHIPDISALYLGFYLRAIKRITKEDMRLNARRFIEDELVFEHERRRIAVFIGIAYQRYKLSAHVLDVLEQAAIIHKIIAHKEDVFIELAHSALIDPILLARQQRIEYEIRLEQEIRQKKILEEKAKEQEKRVQRIRRFTILLLLIVVLLGVSVVIAYLQRQKAVKSQRLANSSLYAVLALRKMHNDPTEALRLAQKAYSIYPQNAYAASALLSVFYRYGLFYQVPDTLTYTFDWAEIEPNTGKILTISLNTNDSKSLITLHKNALVNKQITIPTIINFAIFTPDSGFIAGGWDSTLYYFSPQAELKLKQHLPGIVWTAAIDKNNKRIAVGLSTGQIVILDSALTIKRIWQAHQREIRSLDFSYTSKLVSSADDNLIKLWSADYKLINTIPVYQLLRYQRFIIAPVHFSSDGEMIAAAINDFFNNYYVVRVWNTQGRELLNMKMADKWINDMIFLPESNTILTASNDHSVTFYDMHEGTIKKFLGHNAPVLSVAYNANKQLVYTIAKDNTIRTWLLRPFPGQYLNRIRGYSDFAFSADGAQLIMKADDRVDVFDLLANKIAQYKSACGKIDKIKVQDNYILIFASDGSITVWNPLQGKIRTINYPSEPADAVIVQGKIISIVQNTVNIPEGIYKKIPKINSDSILSVFTDEKNNLFIANVNGINVFNGKKLKGIFINNGVKKVILRKHIWILTRKGELLAINKTLKPDYTTVTTKVKDFDVARNESKIIVLKNNKLLLVAPDGEQIFSYNYDGKIKKFLFNPNSRFFIALEEKNYQTFLKHWICSPEEIIKYIDRVKYFGDIPKFKMNNKIGLSDL